MNKFTLLNLVVLLIGLTLICYGTFVVKYHTKGIEQCKLCEARFNTTSYINGFASGSNYYCVWTKDKSVEDIEETDTHEKCHILLAKDKEMKEHFCGD